MAMKIANQIVASICIQSRNNPVLDTHDESFEIGFKAEDLRICNDPKASEEERGEFL